MLKNLVHSRAKLLLALVLILLVITLSFPLLSLIIYALSLAVNNWGELLFSYIPTYMKNTLLLSLGGGALCLLWGVSCAWLTTNFIFPARKHISWMLVLPLSCPVYISGFIYSDLLSVNFRNFHSITTASLLFGLALYPYVYIFARTAFREQSMNYLWAAQTLGLKNWQIFKRVSMPLALPIISFGLLLAVIEIINDFGLVNHYAINTMSLGIYRVWLGLGDINGAIILSLFTILIVFSIMMAEGYLLSKRKRYENQSRHSPIQVKQLKPLTAWICFYWCMLPIIAGFLLPVISLIYYAVSSNDSFFAAGNYQLLYQSLINTLSLTLFAIALAVTCALLINYSSRLLPRYMQILGQSINICYALPGTLLAFTCIVLFTGVNRLLPEQMALGGLFILVFAYMVRFTPPANRSIHNGLHKITPSMEMAAKIFVIKRWQLFNKIHLPLLKGAIISSCLIIFTELIKELPLALILRPFNFETMATIAYQYAGDERLGVAAIPALIIIISGMPVLYLLNKSFDKVRNENFV